MNVSEIKALLAAHGLRPLKGLGQHFLVDESHLDRIAAAAELGPDDVVVEVGPGLGALTDRLIAQAGQLLAIEFDAGLVPLLQARYGAHPTFHLTHADILTVDVPALVRAQTGRERYKVVANLPYYITSAVLRHLFESAPPPELLVVLIQLEVARRIVAGPGDMSLLAVSVQLYGEPEIVHKVPAGAFYPPPKVDSAILRVTPRPTPAVALTDADAFFEVVRAGFGQKRKQLKNSLNAGLPLPAAEIEAALAEARIDPRRRAETLSLEEWGTLVTAVSAARERARGR